MSREGGVAEAPHHTVQFLFAGMRKRGVADVVGQGQCLREALLQTQRNGYGTRDLRNLSTPICS